MGRPVEPGVDAAVSGVGRAGAGKSDGQARGRGRPRCRRRSGPPEPRRPAGRRLGTVAPVAPRAGAEVVPAGTADRGDTLSGVSVVTVPTAGAVRESTTHTCTPASPRTRRFSGPTAAKVQTQPPSTVKTRTLSVLHMTCGAAVTHTHLRRLPKKLSSKQEWVGWAPKTRTPETT